MIKIIIVALLTLVLPLTVFASTYEERAEMRETDRLVSSEEIKTLVEAIFGPTSPMIPTLQCESSFRQFDSSGVILRSSTNDVGIAQINVEAHGQDAMERGIDIYTIEGNLKYARLLFDQSGTLPWVCAKMI